MDAIDPQLALAQFATLAGGAVVISIVVEALKRAAAWTDATTQRFAPLLSLVLGVILFLAIAVAQGTISGSGALEAVLGGLVTGASAGGLYDVGGKTVLRTVAGTPTGG